MGRASHQSFCESVRGCICAWGGEAGDGGERRGGSPHGGRGPAPPAPPSPRRACGMSHRDRSAPRHGQASGAGLCMRAPAVPRVLGRRRLGCAPHLTPARTTGEDGPATPLNGAKHRAGPAGAAPLTCRAAPGPPPPMPGAPAPRRAGARQRGPPTPRKCVLRRVGPRPRESGCWEDMVGRRSGCWADRPGCLWPRPVNG